MEVLTKLCAKRVGPFFNKRTRRYRQVLSNQRLPGLIVRVNERDVNVKEK